MLLKGAREHPASGPGTILDCNPKEGSVRPRTPGEKPNLLFLWNDQQRADTLAVYGNRTYSVLALNRLADTSVTVDRCYVNRP